VNSLLSGASPALAWLFRKSFDFFDLNKEIAMGTYTADEICEMSNPYQAFTGNNMDRFVKNRDVFNNMAHERQIQLAGNFAKSCPKNELNQFMRTMEAIRDVNKPNSGFYPVLYNAAKVRQVIEGLMDARNNKSYQPLLNPEFQVDLYQEHKDLVRHLVSNHEDDIASHLAIHTPAKHLSAVSKNARHIDSAFTKDHTKEAALGAALELRSCIDEKLLGREPYTFFTNKVDMIDLCNRFPNVLVAYIQGKEQQIARGLARADEKTRGTIFHKLDALLNHVAYREDHPLLKLQTAFTNEISSSHEKSPLVKNSFLRTTNVDDYQQVPLDEDEEYSLASGGGCCPCTIL
jgi:hypothetical protein